MDGFLCENCMFYYSLSQNCKVSRVFCVRLRHCYIGYMDRKKHLRTKAILLSNLLRVYREEEKTII